MLRRIAIQIIAFFVIITNQVDGQDRVVRLVSGRQEIPVELVRREFNIQSLQAKHQREFSEYEEIKHRMVPPQRRTPSGIQRDMEVDIQANRRTNEYQFQNGILNNNRERIASQNRNQNQLYSENQEFNRNMLNNRDIQSNNYNNNDVEQDVRYSVTSSATRYNVHNKNNMDNRFPTTQNGPFDNERTEVSNEPITNSVMGNRVNRPSVSDNYEVQTTTDLYTTDCKQDKQTSKIPGPNQVNVTGIPMSIDDRNNFDTGCLNGYAKVDGKCIPIH